MFSGKFLVLLAIFAPDAARHYPLPKSAVITIGKPYIDAHTDESDVDFCRNYHLTKAQVRAQFQTYRELKDDEMHDFYLFVPCGIEGTVKVNGKTYTWRTQLGGTMETDYPDGVRKNLGGKPTDDLSEGESSSRE